MMNYETFKKEVEKRFINYLSDEMKKMKVEFRQVDKVNRTLDGITVICENTKGKMSPTVYINDMYELYQKCESFEETLFITVLHMSQVVQANIDMNLDISTAKENIIFRVVNTEQNKKLLGNIPNRPFLDLSIIYYWVVQIEEDGFKSTVISNSLAQCLEVTEEELFMLAVENTRRIFPMQVNEMGDMICKFLDPEFADFPIWKLGNKMWVITNTKWINGAGYILYEDELYALAEKLESDLYILPASIHEMIAIPAMEDPYKLAATVAYINIIDLPLEERLSNQVYHYDRKLRKLSLATDTPNKSLLGDKKIKEEMFYENSSNC